MNDMAASPKRRRSTTVLRTLVLIGVYLGMSMALASLDTDAVIDTDGSNNAFLLMFVLGMVGGFTTFTGIPYHLVLMSLAAGGLNPVGLGVSTATGVMLGDSTMYLIGSNVKNSLSPRMQATADRLSGFLVAHPRLVAPILVTYGTISPFSNDFVVGSLSVAGYSYWRTILPLTLGNICYNIGLAYLGLYAYDAIIGWF